MSKKLNTKRLLGSATALLAVTGLIAQSNAPTEPSFELDDLTVTTATRTAKQISTIPQTVSVVFEEDLDAQLAISSDLISAISQMAPSYSPSRQKMSGAGETFRGRNPLFMIDGVPQSNPLRDGGRDGYTLDPVMLQRVELVHGASAAQGLGATGGIINYVTRTAPNVDGLEQWAEVGFTTSDELEEEGLGYRAAYRAGYRSGELGAIGAVAYEWRPMSYDGEGNLVGIDNTQGDTMNSSSLDLYGKVSYSIDADQSVTVMLNRFLMKQDLEYVNVPGNAATGTPATSVKGPTPGKATQNDVITGSVSYRHADLFGGTFSLDVFYQDFAATYGGGTFGTFVYNGVNIFDQSENQSEKHGMKLTFAREIEQLGGLGVVTGIDYLADSTQQILVQTGRAWVPETTYEGWAPYLQLDKVFGPLLVTGGIRYEMAELQVDDFTTLESYNSTFVAGGKPSFEESLYNLGATYRVTDAWSVFGSYTQGFGMADVGRVLRGINTPGEDVDTFLNLDPIVTDNWEIGTRYDNGTVRASFSAYLSTSDLGSRLQADADGIYSVRRERTEIWGWEADLRVKATAKDTFSAVVAWIEGKSDTDGDGDAETHLDGANIPPARLNLAWQREWNDRLSTRLQSSTYFDSGKRGFDGYTTFDALAAYDLAHGTVTVALENLLDEQYLTYYSQTVGNNERQFAGRGRTLTVKYGFAF
jgi:iron complex outermembrane receptor protein